MKLFALLVLVAALANVASGIFIPTRRHSRSPRAAVGKNVPLMRSLNRHEVVARPAKLARRSAFAGGSGTTKKVRFNI